MQFLRFSSLLLMVTFTLASSFEAEKEVTDSLEILNQTIETLLRYRNSVRRRRMSEDSYVTTTSNRRNIEERAASDDLTPLDERRISTMQEQPAIAAPSLFEEFEQEPTLKLQKRDIHVNGRYRYRQSVPHVPTPFQTHRTVLDNVENIPQSGPHRRNGKAHKRDSVARQKKHLQVLERPSPFMRARDSVWSNTPSNHLQFGHVGPREASNDHALSPQMRASPRSAEPSYIGDGEAAAMTNKVTSTLYNRG